MPKKDQNDIKQLVKKEQRKISSDLRVKNANMFRDAKKPQDVQVYLEGQPNLSKDPKSLATVKAEGVAIVKSVQTISPAIKNLTLIDLKLNVVGPFEDEVYSSFPFVIKNIRRGNTVLKIDKEDGTSEYSLGRKGLEKFFDMRFEYINAETRFNDNSLEEDGHHMEKNYILAGPLRAMLEGHEVEVLKTLKANGENVQVSWNEAAQAWVICSKNVALVARERSQIDSYNADRF
jgi:hypothetical protein